MSVKRLSATSLYKALLLVLISTFSFTGKLNAQDGEKLFKANCAACHTITDKKLVGPGLQGINDKREKEWLHKWIKNSQELIASGDADAVAVFEENGKMVMPPQPLSDEEIDAVLNYIANPPADAAPKKEAAAETAGEAAAPQGEDNTFLILGIVIVVLLVLVALLRSTQVSLAKVVKEKTGDEEIVVHETIGDAVRGLIAKNKGWVALFVVVMVVLGAKDGWDALISIGVHEGYKPEQPIKFSHKIHAGLDKIDCNYCHSSARHSKTSGIPSLNVCMNCHKFIDGTDGKTFEYNGETYPMPEEIAKIYKYLDYNKETGKYGDNPTPVKWVKVHNLPDHAYFNHSQHVVAGKQKCQKCHGPVEEMDVVYQYSPLTMGWCINCHRETAVADKGNGYYEEFHARLTDELKEKYLKDGKLTVDEIGGLECAKCHY